ncbi:hypothetical protein BHM03_00037995 [Ensete ventricosum]|nr:hypothetical protein BHM03_00037995 [Ensete ventricosum]
MAIVPMEPIVLRLVSKSCGVFIRLGALRRPFSLIWRKISVWDEFKGIRGGLGRDGSGQSNFLLGGPMGCPLVIFSLPCYQCFDSDVLICALEHFGYLAQDSFSREPGALCFIINLRAPKCSLIYERGSPGNDSLHHPRQCLDLVGEAEEHLGGNDGMSGAGFGRLEGKVAVITGGASGIGESTAKLFVRYGARVVIADIQDDKGRALCDFLGTADACYVHCDVTDESDMRNAVDTAVASYGKLDIMFSNAGTLREFGKGLTNSDKAEFERVMAVNVVGAFLATKHAARVMTPARRGSIVITGSTASALGGVVPHSYVCSKHAVVGLMKSAAAELGVHGVRVNCVSPHGVMTPLLIGVVGMDEAATEAFLEGSTNLKGVKPTGEDVAEAVAYLGGDESRYVSGVNLMVDGGYSVTKGMSFK